MAAGSPRPQLPSADRRAVPTAAGLLVGNHGRSYHLPSCHGPAPEPGLGVRLDPARQERARADGPARLQRRPQRSPARLRRLSRPGPPAPARAPPQQAPWDRGERAFRARRVASSGRQARAIRRRPQPAVAVDIGAEKVRHYGPVTWRHPGGVHCPVPPLPLFPPVIVTVERCLHHRRSRPSRSGRDNRSLLRVRQGVLEPFPGARRRAAPRHRTGPGLTGMNAVTLVDPDFSLWPTSSTCRCAGASSAPPPSSGTSRPPSGTSRRHGSTSTSSRPGGTAPTWAPGPQSSATRVATIRVRSAGSGPGEVRHRYPPRLVLPRGSGSRR